MFETPYYHELIKKATIGFGALFSRVKVIRRNPNDAQAAPQIVSVPIAFGPKEKILTRLDQDPDLNGHTYITLPRMAFEIKKYKSKFSTLDLYFQHARALKELDSTINIINKTAKDNISCSICYEVIKDNQYIDSFICKHYFLSGSTSNIFFAMTTEAKCL